MSPVTMAVMFIVVVVLAVVGFTLWVLRTINRRRKQMPGHAVCEFITDQHTGYQLLLPVTESGLVQPPSSHKKLFDKNNVAPDQRSYVIDELAVIYKPWPAGAMKITQVMAPHFSFHEGYPLAINPYKGEMMPMTPQFLTNMLNEVWSKVAAALGRETEKLLDLIAKAQGIFKPTVFYLLIGLAIGATVIVGYLVVKLTGQVSELQAAVELLRNPSGTP